MKSQNNKFDEVDNMLFDYFKENKDIPKDTENLLNNIKYTKHKTHFGIGKVAIILVTLSTLTTGIVFAKDIYNFIYHIFNPVTTSSGVIKLAESGYLYNTEMDYINNNGIELKIDYLIMDDFNLDIVFNVKYLDSNFNIYSIDLPDLIIYDENNNIIYCYDSSTYEAFCKGHSLDYNDDLGEKNYTNGGYSIELIEQTNEGFIFVCKMYSSNYPKSKELHIQFSTLNIITNANFKDNMDIKGGWNINLNLPEEFYNRKTFLYTVRDNSDLFNNITIEEAVATNSEMSISMQLKIPNNCNISNQINSGLNGESPINSITLINENNTKYSPMTLHEGGMTIHYSNNSDILINVIFPIPENELTNNLTLILDSFDSDIKINLCR